MSLHVAGIITAHNTVELVLRTALKSSTRSVEGTSYDICTPLGSDPAVGLQFRDIGTSGDGHGALVVTSDEFSQQSSLAAVLLGI